MKSYFILGRSPAFLSLALSGLCFAPADGGAGQELDNILGKLSIKSMGCNGRKAAALDEGDKTVIPLASIFGKAVAVKPKTRVGDNGDVITDTPIIGNFEGVNLQTGEVFKSSVLYLPSSLHAALEQALTPSDENPKPLPIKFGVEIGAKKATNKAGFEYVGRQTYKQENEVDPLAEMRAKVSAVATKALPKPSAKK